MGVTEIRARRKEMSAAKFTDIAAKAIHNKIAMSCIQSAADFDGEDFAFDESPQAMYLIQAALSRGSSSFLRPSLTLGKPVVAIGAPAEAWVKDAGALLSSQILVPENADVANAYGAAVGQVMETVELLISLDGDGYLLNTPWDRNRYSSLEEAMFYAIHEGRKHVEHVLADAGCRRWNIEEKASDIMVETKENEPKTYMGTKLIITGIGSAL